MGKFSPKTHDGKTPAKAFIANNKIHTALDDEEWVAWYGSRDIAKFLAKHEIDPCGYGDTKQDAIKDLCEIHDIKGWKNIKW